MNKKKPQRQKIPFVLYDENTGDVLSSGFCCERSLEAIKQRAEATNRLFMEGIGEQGTHKVINGVLTKVAERTPREKTYSVPVPYGDRLAKITNNQLADLLKRVMELESQ